MKNNRLFTTICLMAAILFTACTQDELAERGNTLPDGEYPLQIGSVSIIAESSEEPWTRVTEKPDGSGSVFQDEDRIGVRIAGSEETGIYRIKVDDAGNVTITPDKPVYWKSTQPAEVTAWYPAEASRVSLGSQHMDGLTYVLRGTGTGSYQSPVTLKFEHQLAKVRVVLNGTQASLAQSVEVYGCTTCTNNEGAPIAGDTQGWLKMKHTTYTDGTECWEANVVPGTITLDNFVRINGQTATVNDGFPTTLDASTMYTIDLTVGPKQIFGGETISDDGHYHISGTLGEAVTITGGKPTIYLENAQISVSGGKSSARHGK